MIWDAPPFAIRTGADELLTLPSTMEAAVESAVRAVGEVTRYLTATTMPR
ncbi:hypothetical protein [Nocardia asteroides]|nr:hypothetical protein [Nocardia asteroides]UGT62906.1 hypothetical protein LTT61_06085 [Nocardia asteroides]